ncbi:hypothetical protein HMPREF9087_2312 [Enterococcus casseliflavus ATCC 12755]|uniref:Uncharacterized protein n=1 Tax=Enterococcus casseliflavus ATCC 12755 TaxID=888066 RepID=F0ELM0_ENTCA|nr:hypothetical protein HMPREF9087_2312 [Enterococcus casseliflavus ATCC 12755]
MLYSLTHLVITCPWIKRKSIRVNFKFSISVSSYALFVISYLNNGSSLVNLRLHPLRTSSLSHIQNHKSKSPKNLLCTTIKYLYKSIKSNILHYRNTNYYFVV